MSRRRVWRCSPRSAAEAALLLLFGAPVARGGPVEPPPPVPARQRITLQGENDKVGGSDRYLSNSIKLTYQRTDVGPIAASLSDLLSQVPPLEAAPVAYGFGLAHSIFTPSDTNERLLQPEDRPYAAWLHLALSLTRDGDTAGLPFRERWVLRLGVVGPSAQGDEVQNGWHRLIRVPLADGWDNQLEDQPGIELDVLRRWRVGLWGGRDGLDLQPHAAFTLGLQRVQASGGATLRLGWGLTRDLGPPGRTLSPAVGAPDWPERPQCYLFGRVDGRAVAHNAFVTGDTIRGSPREPSVLGRPASYHVDLIPFVADVEAGVLFSFGAIELSASWVYRTPEFEGQDEPFQFGTLSGAVSW